MLILGIDTSAKIASVALMEDSRLLAENTVYTTLTHSQIILPMVIKLLEDAGRDIKDVNAVAISAGPGSYTGLRIGIAAVKGICMGLDIKAVGVSTLEALAYNLKCVKADIFSVMNARRDVMYFGHYYSDGDKIISRAEDTVCSTDMILNAAEGIKGDIMLVGDLAQNIKERYFADNENVRVAPYFMANQRAALLCQYAFENEDKLDNALTLDAIYLQATKAEKDLNLKN